MLGQRYVEAALPLAVIAWEHHVGVRTVRRWLVEAGIPVWARTSRAQRTAVDPQRLRELYQDREWTAAEIAAASNDDEGRCAEILDLLPGQSSIDRATARAVAAIPEAAADVTALIHRQRGVGALELRQRLEPLGPVLAPAMSAISRRSPIPAAKGSCYSCPTRPSACVRPRRGAAGHALLVLNPGSDHEVQQGSRGCPASGMYTTGGRPLHVWLSPW